MMVQQPTYSLPPSPAVGCGPQQQYFPVQTHLHPLYPSPSHMDHPHPHACPAHHLPPVQPIYSPDPNSHQGFVYPTMMPHAPSTSVSVFSSPQSSPMVESGEWGMSPFEGYTSSVPALVAEDAMSGGASGSGKKQVDVVGRRQRIAMACTYCRRRKIRCDGAEICASCIRSGRVCEYTAVPVDNSKPVRVRRVPLTNDDKRKVLPPISTALGGGGGECHRSHVQGYLQEGTDQSQAQAVHAGYTIQGYVPPMMAETPPGAYGGYSTIPAWSTGVMGPPQRVHNDQRGYPPVTPPAKPFPSVLVSSADGGHSTPGQAEYPISSPSAFAYNTPPRVRLGTISHTPSSSSLNGMAMHPPRPTPSRGPSSVMESCPCGGHSSQTHSTCSSESASPPHTPARQTAAQFASRPVVDLSSSPYYNSSPAYVYPTSSGSSIPVRPSLGSGQYYLPYTPSTPYPGEQHEQIKPQLLYPQAPSTGTGTASSHAGLVGLGISMPPGSVGLFNGLTEQLSYKA